MCNETMQPPETNGTIFLFSIGSQVCQGACLSGAEISRNRGKYERGGPGDLPRFFFFKSMSLRMHLKPF